IFKAENKAMKTASTYPLSISAPNKLFACLVVCMIKYLYNTDIQVITPPPPNKLHAEVAYRHHPAVCWLGSRSYSHTSILQTVCALLHNKIYLLAREE
ncbi:MAG: hypothetical protein RBR84_13210, partial [Bacteroidales bacterium]|nr:hypothetical protein [Bacteroidales bacterium]